MSQPETSVSDLSTEKDLRLAIEVLKREGMARVEAALSGDKRQIEVAESLGRVITDLRRRPRGGV